MTRPLVFTCCLGFALTRAIAADVAFMFRDARNQPIADAVVSLVPVEGPIKPLSPPPNVVIAQEKQEFLPYVTAVQVGTAVNFPNRDTVKHQVYSGSKTKKFELPLYAGEAKEPVVFDRPGVVTVGCNIHDWMLAYVVVLESPWFAKSDATGAAVIAAVPPGRYRAEIWQPRLPTPVKQELNVAEPATGVTTVTLELGRDRRIRRAPDALKGAAKGAGY